MENLNDTVEKEKSKKSYKSGVAIAIETNLASYIANISILSARIMEIRINTGKRTKNLRVLNACSHSSNYEFSESNERWETENNFISTCLKTLPNVGVLITTDSRNTPKKIKTASVNGHLVIRNQT